MNRRQDKVPAVPFTNTHTRTYMHSNRQASPMTTQRYITPLPPSIHPSTHPLIHPTILSTPQNQNQLCLSITHRFHVTYKGGFLSMSIADCFFKRRESYFPRLVCSLLPLSPLGELLSACSSRHTMPASFP